LVQTRLKVKSRSTQEAIVGAVTGTLARPERLILGLPDPSGTLIIAGGTGPLRPGQQRELAALLRSPAACHPWPAQLPAGRTGVFGGPRRLPVVLVEPELVVEVAADAAREYGRWRHVVRLVRVRAQLGPQDLSAVHRQRLTELPSGCRAGFETAITAWFSVAAPVVHQCWVRCNSIWLARWLMGEASRRGQTALSLPANLVDSVSGDATSERQHGLPSCRDLFLILPVGRRCISGSRSSRDSARRGWRRPETQRGRDLVLKVGW
jgi:hypothetical protein